MLLFSLLVNKLKLVKDKVNTYIFTSKWILSCIGLYVARIDSEDFISKIVIAGLKHRWNLRGTKVKNRLKVHNKESISL